ncbi:MAG: FkbM family methyltransferase [Chlorobiaceae bacterium]|nr:FkbM family methyltransferase [Chlorobiaceae bacterium]
MQFYSQFGQDQFLFERFFYGKRDGIFVDIGAYDGKTFSNTLFFEQSLGWTGLCVEPLPGEFEKLRRFRTAACANTCVSDYNGIGDLLDVDVTNDARMLSGLIENNDPRHVEHIDRVLIQKRVIRVPVTTLTNLLQIHNLTRVDYCSIHTEGSELKILMSLDFEQYDISLFTIGNRYRDGRIRDFMAQKGFELAVEFHGSDQLYKKKSLKMLPRTTVICAVWHGDPDRFDLLEGHMANLDRQTRPIDRVYVFDGGDTPPHYLEGHVMIASDRLSIYQAWNLALSMVQTPYVMNLNLDDRLAMDAVDVMERALDAGSDLVGGDWKICYTQEDTDAVTSSFPASELPFVPAWPPAGDPTRLGSGTGLRGTFGPACMWRTHLHQALGRYPYQFGDGTSIRVIGDAVWWHLLAQNKKKLQRIPGIIGNYYSHPKNQAEFRNSATEEEQRLKVCGIRLL